MQSFSYPMCRPRRLRESAFLRELTQEHHLRASDIIWPIFIQEGENLETPIASLPSVARLSIDIAVQKAKALQEKGLLAVALFPVTPQDKKDAEGSEALNPENLICRAIREFKKQLPTLGIIADVALDPYTTHGHDGLIDAKGNVLNDKTLSQLTQQALTLARAGADVIAPSDMMDGRVGAIRSALEKEGFHQTAILAYTAKYASAYYGPFRDAVGTNKSNYLDKRSYQMHPANGAEALKEAALDVSEGADMLMVKPGLPYLDIIANLKTEFPLPILAYHVSGEYAGVMFAAEAGALDAKAVFMEQMLCFKRAGASAILTYATPQLLEWL